MKDIAVLSGQTARFECIVQCDPHPYIEWYRNETPIRNGTSKHFIEFRNGVCRLTIPETISSKMHKNQKLSSIFFNKITKNIEIRSMIRCKLHTNSLTHYITLHFCIYYNAFNIHCVCNQSPDLWDIVSLLRLQR